METNRMNAMNALLSVSNKDGLEEDAKRLVKLGYAIYSSGGTAKILVDKGIPVIDVATLVGGSAILGHRVVTISRELHAGLLADANKPEDLEELVKLNIPFIDFVRVDFYPLEKTIAKTIPFSERAQAIETVVEGTDVGGPLMARSAAKGFRIIVCRKEDMENVLCELEATGKVSYESRQNLRARAEYEVAKYVGHSAMFHGNGKFKIISGERVCDFKGENDHQSPATLYSTGKGNSFALEKLELIEGNAPSSNNFTDFERLGQTLSHIAAAFHLNYGEVPFVAVGGKHGNACGAAVNNLSTTSVAQDVILGDTRAIMGGLIMTNFKINDSTAVAMVTAMPDEKARFDGVVAPVFVGDATHTLSRVTGRCRIMINPEINHLGSASLDNDSRFRYVDGGFITQPNYTFILNFSDEELQTYGNLTVAQEKDLLLAWAICSTSNSNTITIVKDGMLIGNGVGQQDRVGAAELAVKRAVDAGHGQIKGWRNKIKAYLGLKTKNALEGAVACSDSFFPFPDGVQVLIDAGIKAIFSTSGSQNDKLIRALCEANGVTLVQLPDKKARGFFGH